MPHFLLTEFTTLFLLFTCFALKLNNFYDNFWELYHLFPGHGNTFSTLQHLISSRRNIFSNLFFLFFQLAAVVSCYIWNQRHICLHSCFYRHEPQTLTIRCSQSMNSANELGYLFLHPTFCVSIDVSWWASVKTDVLNVECNSLLPPLGASPRNFMSAHFLMGHLRALESSFFDECHFPRSLFHFTAADQLTGSRGLTAV